MTRLEHLLITLGEECNEVGQRLSKAARFGLTEVQPGQPLSNAARIMEEYADLVAVMEMLQAENPPIEHACVELKASFGCLKAAKKSKVERYLAYSRQCGLLDD